MQLQDNIKSEIYYYIKHLSPLFTFRKVLKYCSPADLRNFEGDSLAITRFIKNVKRSPGHYTNELSNVQPTKAPVIAAVHHRLKERFPDLFPNMSFDSSSESSSSSSPSGYHGATQKRAPGIAGRHSSKVRCSMPSKKHSSSDAGLSVDFLGLAVSPHNKSNKIEEAAPMALV
jgi:hypothetical protein